MLKIYLLAMFPDLFSIFWVKRRGWPPRVPPLMSCIKLCCRKCEAQGKYTRRIGKRVENLSSGHVPRPIFIFWPRSPIYFLSSGRAPRSIFHLLAIFTDLFCIFWPCSPIYFSSFGANSVSLRQHFSVFIKS